MKKNAPLNSATTYEAVLEQLSQLPKYGIGRAADNRIKLTDKTISSYHAWLTPCGPTSYLLEDRESKHGTYVNDLRIVRKIISTEDRVRFADNEFTTNELSILYLQKDEIPAPILKKDSLDFCSEFGLLQAVYDQYPTLRKDCRNRDKMIRTGSVILSSVVGIGAVLSSGGAVLPVLSVLSGAGLSMLIPTLCSTLLSTDEKLEVIDKEYRERYRCPNPDCRDSFQGREWPQLALQKTCRRCKAIWTA